MRLKRVVPAVRGRKNGEIWGSFPQMRGFADEADVLNVVSVVNFRYGYWFVNCSLGFVLLNPFAKPLYGYWFRRGWSPRRRTRTETTYAAHFKRHRLVFKEMENFDSSKKKIYSSNKCNLIFIFLGKVGIRKILFQFPQNSISKN